LIPLKSAEPAGVAAVETLVGAAAGAAGAAHAVSNMIVVRGMTIAIELFNISVLEMTDGSYTDTRARANPHMFMRACEWVQEMGTILVKK
jgi:hypothetical protein